MKTMAPKPKKPKKGLCLRLMKIRESLGLTQAEAAEKVFVTMHAWVSWETGRRLPTRGHLKLIDLLEHGQL